MLTRRPRRTMNQINVVPYIDVMLVLLVIFMVTTPMFSPGVINLPSVSQAEQVHSEPIQLQIDRDGQLSLLDQGKTLAVTSLDQLIPALKAQLAGQNRPVVISADKTLTYEKVMDVMSRLQQANISRTGLLVKADHE